MEITEVRIKLMEDPQERLQAFCSLTFDHCFVIRDLKIIEGTKGSFVAMPSRKLTDRCPNCNTKNHLRAGYCNQCGAHLQEDRAGKDDDGRAKLYADIAHPINSRCREQIQLRVIEAFREEQIKAKLPGYVCTYDDYGEDRFAVLSDSEILRREQTPVGSPDSYHRIETAHDDNHAPHILPMTQPRETTEPRVVRQPLGESNEVFGAGIL